MINSHLIREEECERISGVGDYGNGDKRAEDAGAERTEWGIKGTRIKGRGSMGVWGNEGRGLKEEAGD